MLRHILSICKGIFVSKEYLLQQSLFYNYKAHAEREIELRTHLKLREHVKNYCWYTDKVFSLFLVCPVRPSFDKLAIAGN